MFQPNQIKTKSLFTVPPAINVSSDGTAVSFDNKTVFIGTGNSTDNDNGILDPEIKLNIVGKTQVDGNVKLKKNVYIGGATNSDDNVKLDVSGNSNISGSLNTNELVINSDYRLKHNVLPLDDTFVVDHLKPVVYSKNNSTNNEIGFIAHELQEHFPDMVRGDKDADTFQSINYIDLIGILVNEIQLLKKRVVVLENES